MYDGQGQHPTRTRCAGSLHVDVRQLLLVSTRDTLTSMEDELRNNVELQQLLEYSLAERREEEELQLPR